MQTDLLNLAAIGGDLGNFPISMEGKTERLFGRGDCTTVIVRVDVLSACEEEIDVMLGTKEDEIDAGVEEMERAGTVLLLIDMAGAEAER